MSETEIHRVLDFWFSGRENDSPKIDARMDRWFGDDPALDEQIREQFGELVARASAGELDDWAATAQGRLALIILLDQFRRNIYRGEAAAYACDRQALKLCVEGTLTRVYRALSPEEQLFFFMPLQHAESRKIQAKSVSVYRALAARVSETLRETFLTAAQFAELHRDIIEAPEEEAYLAGDASNFGQQSG